MSVASLELDLANSANWEQIYYSSRSVRPISNIHFEPLSEVDVTGGILLNAPIIATFAASSTKRDTWKTAGWLSQKIRIGVSVGGTPDAESADSRRVLFDKVKLHFWSRKFKNYQLKFAAPNWVTQLDLTIWQYTGPYVDPLLEASELTRIDVLRTEKKIDYLLNS